MSQSNNMHVTDMIARREGRLIFPCRYIVVAARVDKGGVDSLFLTS